MSLYLDPEVEALFAMAAQHPVPTFRQMGVAEGRRFYEAQGAALGGPVVEMADIRDLSAEGPAGSIPLRLYRPKGLTDASAPTLVYFHGGGWVIGSIASHDRVCRQIAHRAGCAVLSVEYRLAPEHPAPAGPVDAIAALLWIAEHAGEFGCDPRRLAVGGDSAGGALSAVVALAARDAGLSLRGQVLIYPCTDVREASWSSPSRVLNATVPPLTQDAATFLIDEFLADRNLADDWRVSPIAASSFAGVAPALVITGSRDILLDDGLGYAARLRDAEVPVIHRNFPGMVHGFIELAGVLSATHTALDTIAFFLRERLSAA
ncbi:alpha/beta hydrolase [Aureimonas ureilytica]|uniref:alpha/beta hydrolase n=1 Tax=Aureimonas ureilytica TaxID=401562 RepID=UPI00037B52D5|nr:alpha/beta hydrolase [Aureimonas ureilytica]